MSGSDFTVACPKCQTNISLRGKAMTLALTCPSCNVYFRRGKWEKGTDEFNRTQVHALPLGSKGRIDGHLYEVMGVVTKWEVKYRYEWREYFLFNPYRGYAFLSEYNGHWNFIWPIESEPTDNKSTTSDFYVDGNHFQLYQRYQSKVIYASGEFFFDVVGMVDDTTNYEYIAPPHLMALEKNTDSVLWCQGIYMTRNEVADAFKIPASQLPAKSGIGYTQPFVGTFNDESLITLTVVAFLALIFVQIFLNTIATEKVVFKATYDRNELKDQKLVATPVFELQGGTRSVEMTIHAPLQNDWFFGEFTLVNETDGTEYNFTKEVEYYSGYEGGESWSEGSTTGTAFLSQIPAGRYHINIYPEFSFSNNSFDIIVAHDVPVYTNFFFACIALLLFPAGFFLLKRYREQRRWKDSDYSPYATE